MFVSLCALFVALGGTSYAVSRLPKNSVGTKQIKSNAITSSKVKDGSLLSKDFKAGQLPAGAPGPQGAQGPRGDAGPAGADGATGSALLTGAITTALPQPPAGTTYFRRVPVNSVEADSGAVSASAAQSLTPARTLRISSLAVRANNDLPVGGTVGVTVLVTAPDGANSTLSCEVVGGAGASDQTCASSGSATAQPGSLVYVLMAIGRSLGGPSTVNPEGVRWGFSLEPAS